MNTYPIVRALSHRLGIILALFLVCTLSACENSITSIIRPPQTNGPIQLYDTHGTLLCQLHGHNQQVDCLAPKSIPRQSAFQFIDQALSELASDLHVSVANLPSSALNVSTTLDFKLQQQVLQKAKDYIATMHTYNMTNAAIVMLDYHNGAIRSLLGSLDSSTAVSPLNVATQNGRQPASLFKPFVYATAFEQGISPGEVIYDGPFSVGTPPYSPLNYDQKFHGYISYRSALQNNFNIPVLKLYIKTGFTALRKNVLAMGLTPGDIRDNYSLPLGPQEAPLLDLTTAYATMANGGIHIPPHAIEIIKDASGHIIYATKPQRARALSPQTAFMMTNIMSDEHAHTMNFGACSPFELYTTTREQCLAGNPGAIRPAAVHSGLSDAFKDSMAIGYTANLVTGVWAGNSDISTMNNITDLDGGSRIWHDSMLLAEAGQPVQQFPGPPPGVVQKTVAYPNLTTTDWYSAT